MPAGAMKECQRRSHNLAISMAHGRPSLRTHALSLRYILKESHDVKNLFRKPRRSHILQAG
jgi:hypothetical protein